MRTGEILLQILSEATAGLAKGVGKTGASRILKSCLIKLNAHRKGLDHHSRLRQVAVAALAAQL